MTSQEALQRIRRVVRSPRLYAQNFLKIITKAGTMEPLEYNEAQRAVEDVWGRLEADGKPVRLIILKARRLGISTYVQARGMHYAATRKYRHVKIVAHEEDSTKTLFSMAKTFYDEMPEEIQVPGGGAVRLKPAKEYSNEKKLTFGDLKSQITLKTAGKDTESRGSSVGRSETVHFLHCSEVAFWPAAKQTLTALLQTVPNLPGTAVVLESTANGVGDHFHRLVMSAQAGESDYTLIFLPWWMFTEYAIPLVPGEEFTPDAEERELIERFPEITPEKLKWRRYTIRNECGGDVDQFHQEYPSDVQEAFLVSGRPFFNAKAVLGLAKTAPIKRGYLRETAGRVQLVEDAKGYVSIWEEPLGGECYCVGADVAEGLDKGDYSAAQVLRRSRSGPLVKVAKWHGHIDADLFGTECVKLAKYYNQAYLGIEVNNHGLTTNKAAVKAKYYRLFKREVIDEQFPDETDKLGWRTDTQSRPVMLDDLEKAIREGTLVDNDAGTIGEFLTFVRNSKGKPEAQTDCYDDQVMAEAIAVQMHHMCPMVGVVSEEERARRERARRENTKPRVSSITGY